MKFNVVSFIMVTFITLLFSVSFAGNPKVQINGQIIDFTDANGNVVEPQIINSRTMVPLRKIFEELGAEVLWEDSTKTCTGKLNAKEVKLTIDSDVAYVRDTSSAEFAEVKLDSPAVIVDDRTLVPLRFISESLGKEVGWDGSTQTAIIIDYGYFVNKLKSVNPKLNDLLNNTNNKITFQKKYNDLVDSSKSYEETIIIDAKNNDVSISFDGNSELYKEISNEEWNNIEYSLEKNSRRYIY